MLVSNCIEVLIFIALRFYLIYQNRKRDNLAAAVSGEPQEASNQHSYIDASVDQRVFEGADQEPTKDSESLGGISTVRPHENDTAFADMTDLQNVK